MLFKEDFIYEIVIGLLFTAILIIQLFIIKEKIDDYSGIYQTLKTEKVLNYKTCFEKDIKDDDLKNDLGNKNRILIIYHSDITKEYCKETGNVFYDNDDNFVFKNLNNNKLKEIEYFIYGNDKRIIHLK